MKENCIEYEASKQHFCSYRVTLFLLKVIWKPEPAIVTVFSQGLALYCTLKGLSIYHCNRTSSSLVQCVTKCLGARLQLSSHRVSNLKVCLVGDLAQSICNFPSFVYCLSSPKCINGHRRKFCSGLPLSTGIPSTLEQFLCVSWVKTEISQTRFTNLFESVQCTLLEKKQQ